MCKAITTINRSNMTWGSHGGDCGDGCLLGRSAVQGDRPDDGGSTGLWNVGTRTPVYTAVQPGRQPSSFINSSLLNSSFYICIVSTALFKLFYVEVRETTALSSGRIAQNHIVYKHINIQTYNFSLLQFSVRVRIGTFAHVSSFCGYMFKHTSSETIILKGPNRDSNAESSENKAEALTITQQRADNVA
jgi:hypothetical protein